MRTSGMRRAFLHMCAAACAVSCVLVCDACQRARPTAPTVLAREMRRSALRPPRSAIVRLRSGAVASRSGAFRIAAFRGGGGGPRGWHWRAGGLRRASTPPPQIRLLLRCAIHPRMRLAWLGRNAPVALQRRIAASGAPQRRICSGPVAGTPHPLCASCTCPFLRCAFRAPYIEQSESIVS